MCVTPMESGVETFLSLLLNRSSSFTIPRVFAGSPRRTWRNTRADCHVGEATRRKVQWYGSAFLYYLFYPFTLN